MIFARPSSRPAALDRSIVPMINVVFLLLIFFLMTASLTQPPPTEITPPMAEAAPIDPPPGTLFIDAEGRFYFGSITGPGALDAMAAEAQDPQPVLADAALPAAVLARLLPELAAREVRRVDLQTVTP